MPSINHQRHYQPLEARIITVSEEALDIDNLARCIAAHSDIAIEPISTALNKHAGIDSSYTFKPRLIEILKQLHAALEQDNLSKDNKVVIASKLTEELNSCTPGFENRTIEILLSLQRPTTMDDFLELIRRDIVDVTARASSSDVHSYNQFFIFAAQHYGVRPINPDDVYASNELSESKQVSLQRAFETRYTFTAILSHLSDRITSELTNYYGYDNYSEKGYNNGIYQPIIDFFRRITNQPEATHQDIFILVDDEIITDINWPTCHKMLFKRLLEDTFFEFSESEQDFFSGLDNDDSSILESLLQNEHYANILKQLDLLKHPGVLEFFPKQNSLLLINTLFHDGLTLAELLDIARLYKRIYPRQSEIDIVVNYLNSQSLSPQLYVNYLTHLLRHDTNNFSDALILMLQDKSLEEQERILSADLGDRRWNYNLLTGATAYNANALPTLISAMQNISPEVQHMIWTRKEAYTKFNVLMIAKQRKPDVLPVLISAIQNLPPQLQETIWTDSLLQAIKLRFTVSDITKAIQNLSPKLQQAIWTDKSSGSNLLIFAIYLSSSIRPIVDAIQNLNSELQHTIWTDESSGNNALTLAIRLRSSSLPYLISAIQKLPLKLQQTIWTAKAPGTYNALTLAILSHSDTLPIVLKAIEQLPLNTQHQLFSEKEFLIVLNSKIGSLSDYGLEGTIKKCLQNRLGTTKKLAALAALEDIRKIPFNAIDVCMMNNIHALPSLIDAIKRLPQKIQNVIWSGNMAGGRGALMLAAQAQYYPNALPAVISAIEKLSPEAQQTIWTRENNDDYNALMLAATYEPNCLLTIISAIQKLSPEAQQTIWTAKLKGQDTILMLAKKHQPSALPMLISAIEQLPLKTQAKLLSEKDFTASLNREINSLSNTGLEGSIKTCLQAMHYNKKEKQIAVLTALKDLKETAIDGIDGGIRRAVNDRTSALYQALNIKRYPFRFFSSAQSETGSLQTIKNAPMILGH